MKSTNMHSDYTKKMDTLCEALGWEALATLCPLPLKDIKAALDAGDEHLNTWGNDPWDRVALGTRVDAPKTIKCGSCGHRSPNPENVLMGGLAGAAHFPYNRLLTTASQEPWCNGPKGLSWSERNSALKHAARRAVDIAHKP